MRILYVEDSASDAELARLEIARRQPSWTLSTAASLAEARGLLAGEIDFDLALVDQRLPDGKGLELVAEIRQRGLPVAAAILTGVGDEPTAIAALKAGADDYITKRHGYVERLPDCLQAALARFLADGTRRSGALRVLYAEQHAADVVLTRAHLAAHAPHVRLEAVATGDELLARLPGTAAEACACDVVLLDYRLPGRTALEVLAVIRLERRLDIPVVLVTGQGDEEVAAQAIRLGASAYLVKRPGYLEALPATVEDAYHRTLLARERAALRESEGRFREIAENVESIFWMTDPARRRFLYVSPAYERVWGRSCDAVRTDPHLWDDAIHPDDRSRVTQAALALQSGGSYEQEYRVVRPDGGTRWIHDKAFPVLDETKRIERVVGVAEDVTGRKSAEEALRQSEARFSKAFACSPDVLMMIRLDDGEILEFNDTFVRLSGYSREEATGRTTLDLGLWVDPAERERYLFRLRAAGSVREEPARFRDRSGKLYDVLLSAEVFPLGKELVALASVHDVTQRNRTEEERRALEAQLRQAQKMEAVGRLAGGIAHDFNNMLGVILGHADMALRALEPGDSVSRNLRAIRDAAVRSADLTRQLVAFSRQQAIAPRVLDLNGQLQGMKQLLQRLIGEDIELKFDFAPELWPVLMDPSQVDQILANLVVNSRDAMPDGGSLTVATANVRADAAYCEAHPGARPGDYVMLTVSDTGVGMDERTLEQAFEPFFTTKAEGKGTGLGLATVYGVVKQNEGFANLYSEVGQGTVVRVYLPRSSERQGEELREAVSPPAERGGETILLVEDQRELREIARTVLEELGYAVLEAAGAREAISLCEQHPGDVHLLLTDVVMPVMNGRVLAERIAAMKPGIRTLFTSGYTADTIAHRGVLEPGIHFIEKPFTLESLARKVREVLG